MKKRKDPKQWAINERKKQKAYKEKQERKFIEKINYSLDMKLARKLRNMF